MQAAPGMPMRVHGDGDGDGDDRWGNVAMKAVQETGDGFAVDCGDARLG